MIVDTSALVAVVYGEDGIDGIFAALAGEPGTIITPVLVELRRVTALSHNRPSSVVDRLLDKLQGARIVIASFTAEAADAAAAANARYGSGRGLLGPLNLLDLMVYGAAKVSGEPILCTGKDFTATDALIHPASRRDP